VKLKYLLKFITKWAYSETAVQKLLPKADKNIYAAGNENWKCLHTEGIPWVTEMEGHAWRDRVLLLQICPIILYKK